MSSGDLRPSIIVRVVVAPSASVVGIGFPVRFVGRMVRHRRAAVQMTFGAGRVRVPRRALGMQPWQDVRPSGVRVHVMIGGERAAFGVAASGGVGFLGCDSWHIRSGV